MSTDNLANQSLEFAAEIINLVRFLQEKNEFIISKQIGKSGTSIGANIREAKYASSKPDFVVKLQISLKEANETGYWLDLLLKTNYIDSDYYKKLNRQNADLISMLIASLKTLKNI